MSTRTLRALLRDVLLVRDKVCQLGLHPDTKYPCTKVLQACHIKPYGQHTGLRFELCNAFLGCSGHHLLFRGESWHDTDPDVASKMKARLRSLPGWADRIDEAEKLAVVRKAGGRNDKVAIRLYLEAELERLKKAEGSRLA